MGRTRLATRAELDPDNVQSAVKTALVETDKSNEIIDSQTHTVRELQKLNDQMEEVTDEQVEDHDLPNIPQE